jgi:hypothetical protein
MPHNPDSLTTTSKNCKQRSIMVILAFLWVRFLWLNVCCISNARYLLIHFYYIDGVHAPVDPSKFAPADLDGNPTDGRENPVSLQGEDHTIEGMFVRALSIKYSTWVTR